MVFMEPWCCRGGVRAVVFRPKSLEKDNVKSFCLRWYSSGYLKVIRWKIKGDTISFKVAEQTARVILQKAREIQPTAKMIQQTKRMIQQIAKMKHQTAILIHQTARATANCKNKTANCKADTANCKADLTNSKANNTRDTQHRPTIRTTNLNRTLIRGRQNTIKQNIRMTKKAFKEGFQHRVKSDSAISRSDRSHWHPFNEGSESDNGTLTWGWGYACRRNIYISFFLLFIVVCFFYHRFDNDGGYATTHEGIFYLKKIILCFFCYCFDDNDCSTVAEGIFSFFLSICLFLLLLLSW